MRTVKLIQPVKHDQPFIVGDAGSEVLLADDVAAFAVQQKFGVYTGGTVAPPPPPSQPDLTVTQGVSPALPDDHTGELSSQPAGEAPKEPETTEPPKRPYGNAPKQAWAEYAAAVDEDMSVDRALGMSKADLMSRYGERLLYTEGPEARVRA